MLHEKFRWQVFLASEAAKIGQKLLRNVFLSFCRLLHPSTLLVQLAKGFNPENVSALPCDHHSTVSIQTLLQRIHSHTCQPCLVLVIPLLRGEQCVLTVDLWGGPPSHFIDNPLAFGFSPGAVDMVWLLFPPVFALGNTRTKIMTPSISCAVGHVRLSHVVSKSYT